jgi:uncharacterized protein
MIRIAVISDTHDKVPAGLPARLSGADEIWHLGDVCEPLTLAPFEALGKPMYTVLGNNEEHERWPLELRLERGGYRFYLTHIPPSRTPVGVQFVLHGHTHAPRDSLDEAGVRWLNPGCITRPTRSSPPSFAWLTIEPGRPPDWKLVLV